MSQQVLDVKQFKALRKKGVKKAKEEENVQIAVCAYLKHKYPDVIFTCDLASGMKLPIWLAARNKKMRSSSGLPDLFIAQPNKRHHGLFIELKKEKSGTILKDGSVSTKKHVVNQNNILQRLNHYGYSAVFAEGYREAIGIIDAYLSSED